MVHSIDKPSHRQHHDETSRVEVTIPADLTRLSLLRSVAAALAVSLDFDIDTMADLRMAVDELATTVVRRTRDGSQIQVEFVAGDESVSVTAQSPARDETPFDTSTFGWMVLGTLATDVTGTVTDVDGDGPQACLSLVVRAAQSSS